jgi:hypothetical protein
LFGRVGHNHINAEDNDRDNEDEHAHYYNPAVHWISDNTDNYYQNNTNDYNR